MGIPQFLKSSKNFKVKQNLELLNNMSPKHYYNRPFFEKNEIKEGITRYNTSSSLGKFCKMLKKENEPQLCSLKGIFRKDKKIKTNITSQNVSIQIIGFKTREDFLENFNHNIPKISNNVSRKKAQKDLMIKCHSYIFNNYLCKDSLNSLSQTSGVLDKNKMITCRKPIDEAYFLYFQKDILKKVKKESLYLSKRQSIYLNEKYFFLSLTVLETIVTQTSSISADTLNIITKKLSDNLLNNFSINYRSCKNSVKRTIRRHKIVENTTGFIVSLSGKNIYFYNIYLFKDNKPQKEEIKSIQFRYPFLNQTTRMSELQAYKRRSTLLNKLPDKIKQYPITNINFLTNSFFSRKKGKNKKIEKFQIQIPFDKMTLEEQETLLNANMIRNTSSKVKTIMKTHEIKAQIQNSCKTIYETMIFIIKNGNFSDFMRKFETSEINVNYQDLNGNTFLIFAVCSNSFLVVKFLIEKGANPNIANVSYNYLLVV